MVTIQGLLPLVILATHTLCLPTSERPGATTRPVNHTPTESFLHQKQLDKAGDYFLYWKTNETHITFEVHVKTRGYVGFGISPNGAMYPSDVVVGWVKDGQTHFSVKYIQLAQFGNI